MDPGPNGGVVCVCLLKINYKMRWNSSSFSVWETSRLGLLAADLFVKGCCQGQYV